MNGTSKSFWNTNDHTTTHWGWKRNAVQIPEGYGMGKSNPQGPDSSWVFYPFTCGSASPGESGFLQVGHKTQRESGTSRNGLAHPDTSVRHYILCLFFSCIFPLYSLSTCYRCYHVTTCHVDHMSLQNDFLTQSIHCMHISNGAQSVKKVTSRTWTFKEVKGRFRQWYENFLGAHNY